ncbi:MAG: DUF4160 domain-containing protein [Rhodothermales bacterium]
MMGPIGMPRISEFFGISIYLYFDDRSHHALPHIHAMYSGNEAVYSIQNGIRLAGQLPRRQDRLVKKWMSLRTSELEHAWQCAVKMEDPGQIKPLT